MLEFIKDHLWGVLIFINYGIAISVALVILFKNLNPTKTLSYIIVLVFLPFLGVVIYYFFGQEYRKNKIFNRKYIYNKKKIKEINEELKLNPHQKQKLKEVLDEKVKLVKLLYHNQNSPLTLHNNLKILVNGEEKFKYLMADLKKAENHIHFEYYILKDDTTGTQILDILCDKAKAGVEVRVSYDGVGSSISSRMLKKMKQSGVKSYPFMPVFFPRFTSKMNYRNHRKIAIIDGKIGYVGGLNISDNYNNAVKRKNKPFWRDTHLRMEGEAVKSLQIHFLMTWDFVSNEKFKVTKTYFPETSIENEAPVQIAASGPDTDWANIMEAIFTAILTAESYVYITTPYFIPNDEILSALQVASKSGVEVKLLIPKESDSWTAKYATDSYLEPLLEAGVQVYRYTKGFIHAKTIVVDDLFSTIGTSNIDYRSFSINFEINALIYNQKESKLLKKIFEDDLKDSEKVTLNKWQARPKTDLLKESFCRLWSPLL
ncbi:MAG: cardiolipin synthase [Mangrovimonas sp.]|nr:cardiolipin synthase [Mangrovimonas sp.]